MLSVHLLLNTTIDDDIDWWRHLFTASTIHMLLNTTVHDDSSTGEDTSTLPRPSTGPDDCSSPQPDYHSLRNRDATSNSGTHAGASRLTTHDDEKRGQHINDLPYSYGNKTWRKIPYTNIIHKTRSNTLTYIQNNPKRYIPKIMACSNMHSSTITQQDDHRRSWQW